MSEEDTTIEFTNQEQTQLAPAPSSCCGKTTIRLVPDELRELPSTPPEPVEPDYTPQPITIYNHTITVFCTEPYTTGDPVTTPEATFTTKLYFSTILSLTDNVLQHIAKQHLEPEIERRLHTGTLTPRDLRKMTGMKLVQAKDFLMTARPIQEQQDTYAREAALAKLECFYWNTEQTATCDDEEMARTGEHPDAVYTATIAAHNYSSTLSQEDADTKAMTVAKSMLHCFYLNDEVEADCTTRPGRPEDEMEPVPNDDEPIYPGRSLRVGHVMVAARTQMSATSKEDANNKALAVAYGMLNCWYPNLPVHAECDDPTARSYLVNPAISPAKPADIETKTPGQFVDIPFGYFTSELSYDTATQEAEVFAETLIECCYINDPIDLACQDEEVVLDNGEIIIAHPDMTRPNSSLHVLAGQYGSCVSKEEANLVAQQSVEGLLNCEYCNKMILPTCVPNWIIEGVLKPEGAKGHIPLPLNGTITDGVHSINLADLPPEATVGAPEGYFCGAAQQAQDVAVAAGGAKTQADADCISINDAVFVTCAGVDPFTGEELEPNIPHARTHPETQEAYIFFTLYPSQTCIAAAVSRPSKGDYISVPAGMFSELGSNRKDLANKDAIEFAMSALTCTFTNPPGASGCVYTDYAKDLCDPNWVAGSGKDPLGLAAFSTQYAQIGPGYVYYTGIGNDVEYATEVIKKATMDYLRSLLLCVYTNSYVERKCETVGRRGKGDERECQIITNRGADGIVPANSVYADSYEEAQVVANAMADSMVACDINTICPFWFHVPDPEEEEYIPPPPQPDPPDPDPNPDPPQPDPPDPDPNPDPSNPTPNPNPDPSNPTPNPNPDPSNPTPNPNPDPDPSEPNSQPPNPGPGPGPGPGAPYSSPPQPPPPPPGPEEPCCYSSCPCYEAGEQQESDSIENVQNQVAPILETVNAMLGGLESKATMLEQELDNLIAQYS